MAYGNMFCKLKAIYLNSVVNHRHKTLKSDQSEERALKSVPFIQRLRRYDHTNVHVACALAGE
jgi:hypothetical protein